MSDGVPWSDADVKELKDKIVNLFNAKEITNVETTPGVSRHKSHMNHTQRQKINQAEHEKVRAEVAAAMPAPTAPTLTELSARRILTHLNRKQRRAVAAERRAGLSLVAALKKLNLLPLTV